MTTATRWALIVGGSVANVVEQVGPPEIDGTWVECDAAGPGWAWDGETFQPPRQPAWSDPALDQRYFWIDVGSFFDRFGLAALSITSSTDPEVQGLVTLILPRKYVDLRRLDLPMLLSILVSKGLIDEPLKAAALEPITSEAERYVLGLPQPTETT